MNEKIFREKSLGKVKSPENLDDYIKVSNPGVWLLLICVIVLLLGAGLWGVYGHISSTVPTEISVENGTAICRIEAQYLTSVHVGMTVQFADTEAVITQLGELDGTHYALAVSHDEELPCGLFDGKIITESYKPLSFILN